MLEFDGGERTRMLVQVGVTDLFRRRQVALQQRDPRLIVVGPGQDADARRVLRILDVVYQRLCLADVHGHVRIPLRFKGMAYARSGFSATASESPHGRSRAPGALWTCA